MTPRDKKAEQLRGASASGPGPEEPQENEKQQAVVEVGNSPEAVLRKHGLSWAGYVYVVESKIDLQKKATELRSLYGELTLLRMQQKATGSPAGRQHAIEFLIGEIESYKLELRRADEEMSQMPRFQWGSFSNNFEAERHALHLAFRQQCEVYLARITAYRDQPKSVSPRGCPARTF